MKKCRTFASHLRKTNAQMAESVDALVSNTSGATHPGSIPGLGTKKTCKLLNFNACRIFLFVKISKLVTFGHHFEKVAIFFYLKRRILHYIYKELIR